MMVNRGAVPPVITGPGAERIGTGFVIAARRAGSPRPGLSPVLWVPPPFCCSALWPVRL
jgi:hypothetical protein